jgi:hypothetical protein
MTTMDPAKRRSKNLRVGMMLAGGVLLYVAALIGYMVIR